MPMHGPDHVVDLVLNALTEGRWDDVLRWTHPKPFSVTLSAPFTR
jgi:hypothetical protein